MNCNIENPLQWQPAMGVARQVCARVFRDGGRPADALTAFGLDAGANEDVGWSRAVEAIARRLCRGALPKAA